MTSVMELTLGHKRILIVVNWNSLRSKVLAAVAAGIFLVPIVGAEDVAKLPQPTGYVNDFAGVIDEGSKAQMEALSAQLAEKAHATIEIVTIKSLDGQNIDEFSTALEDKWKVGARGTDKGILMVFAMAEHKDRIEVGYGLEGILNDAKVGDIRRSMHAQLSGGQMGPGILIGQQQIANVIAKDANVTLDSVPTDTETYSPAPIRHHRGTNWPGILIFIFILIIASRGGRGGGGWMWFLLGNMMGGGFGGGGRNSDGEGFGGGGGSGDFGGGFGGGSGGGGASGDF